MRFQIEVTKSWQCSWLVQYWALQCPKDALDSTCFRDPRNVTKNLWQSPGNTHARKDNGAFHSMGCYVGYLRSTPGPVDPFGLGPVRLYAAPNGDITRNPIPVDIELLPRVNCSMVPSTILPLTEKNSVVSLNQCLQTVRSSQI